MYDQREKAQRDYEWALSGARDEGMEQGKLAGQIQLLQQLLAEPPSSDADLRQLTREALASQLVELQKRLRERPV